MPIPPSKYKEATARDMLKSLLIEWNGEYEGALKIIDHDKDIRTLNELNESFIADAIPVNLQQQIELSANWQEIVSPQFAALVGFSSLDENGVLFLEVRHSAFLQEELLKSADLLLNRINGKLGKIVCKEIRFVPSGRNSYYKNKKSGI